MEIKFNNLGQRVVFTVNDQPANTNTWYDIDSDFKASKSNPEHYGEPYDSVRYVAKEDDSISNEAVITINFPPDKAENPWTKGLFIESENNTEYTFEDLLLVSGNFDRIRIVSYVQGVGLLTFNNNPVYNGLEFMSYDIDKLKFKTGNGTGSPYQQIVYQVGNKERYSLGANIEFNIPGEAYLDEPIIVGANPNNNYKASTGSVLIKNGKIRKRVVFTVELITESTQIFDSNYEGGIVINEVDIATTGVYEYQKTLNDNGEFDVIVNVSANRNITDGDFNFIVTLISIDGIDQSENPNNQKTITLNL